MRELFELLSGDKSAEPATWKARVLSVQTDGSITAVFEGKVVSAVATTDELIKAGNWVHISKADNNFFIIGTAKG